MSLRYPTPATYIQPLTLVEVNPGRLMLIGHKGAAAIELGNTLASFRAAADAGVDAIELDVLRPRADFEVPSEWSRAPAGPATASGPLLVAHDWADAAARAPLTLSEALDAFCQPPLDRLRFDLDLKTIGREDEVVASIRERGLEDRAMTSTMELPSVRALAELAPDMYRGWTLPKVGRDWTKSRMPKPLLAGAMAALRARLPGIVRRRAPELGLAAIWVYHPLASRALADASHDAGCELICWTVDDPSRMRDLVALGADGICTNDPRLFGRR
ncbi:MAG: glycerophosphodiester phosphodiesterase [Actinomycetota bacterium]|nr:glycerophosphodiester phosphodiesterase [Actinomycetota bacterium]